MKKAVSKKPLKASCEECCGFLAIQEFFEKKEVEKLQ